MIAYKNNRTILRNVFSSFYIDFGTAHPDNTPCPKTCYPEYKISKFITCTNMLINFHHQHERKRNNKRNDKINNHYYRSNHNAPLIKNSLIDITYYSISNIS